MFHGNKIYLCAHTTVALPTVEITNTINMFVVSLVGDKTTRVHHVLHPLIGDRRRTMINLVTSLF